MLCVSINSMIVMQLHIESIVALVPYDQHAWVCVAGEWDGVNLPRGPDVVEICPTVLTMALTVVQNPLMIMHELHIHVELSACPFPKVDECPRDLCL
jgi:hypothetical protein